MSNLVLSFMKIYILKPNMVIMHLKVILVQIVQTTSNIKNYFCINISKHKSIHFQLTFNQN
jgi:hypothetical protein